MNIIGRRRLWFVILAFGPGLDSPSALAPRFPANGGAVEP